jgi:hypothetical protein
MVVFISSFLYKKWLLLYKPFFDAVGLKYSPYCPVTLYKAIPLLNLIIRLEEVTFNS